MFMLFLFKQKTAYELRISDLEFRRVLFRSCLRHRGRERRRYARVGPPLRSGGICRRPGARGDARGGTPRLLCRHERAGRRAFLDRKSVVSGKSVSVRVDLGGRRIIKKKNVEENIEYKSHT